MLAARFTHTEPQVLNCFCPDQWRAPLWFSLGHRTRRCTGRSASHESLQPLWQRTATTQAILARVIGIGRSIAIVMTKNRLAGDATIACSARSDDIIYLRGHRLNRL